LTTTTDERGGTTARMGCSMSGIRTQRLMTAALALLGALLWLSMDLAEGAASTYRPVTVGKGRVGAFDWHVSVSRGYPPKAGLRPCLGVSTLDREPPNRTPRNDSVSEFTEVCSPLRVDLPNVVAISIDSGMDGLTLAALAVAPVAHTVTLSYGDGMVREVRTRALSAAQQSTSGVRRGRFAAVALEGASCLHQVAAFDRAGREVFREPFTECE
jgi:hypothetical protein